MLFRSFLAAVLLAGSACAQTSTDCNPLNKTCPGDGALGTNYTIYLNQTLDDQLWTVTNTLTYSGDHADFSIKKALDSPTMTSSFYIFFGRLEVVARASPGRGIVSSIVLESDDLDEIDWEWLGGDPKHVQTNYFGKGNRTMGNRGQTLPGPDATAGFHNYTYDWTQDRLQWWMDDKLIRTVKYEDALNGKNYPQTPCRVKIGNWPAGDPKHMPKGTVEWAGGEVEWDKGPFTMSVKQVYVKDYSSGQEYTYGDKTGSYKSIKTVSGKSDFAKIAHKPPHKSLRQHYHDLSPGAKAGISIGALSVAGLLAVVITICCIVQRRRGRKEFNVEQSRFTSQVNENISMQSQFRQKHQGRYLHLPEKI